MDRTVFTTKQFIGNVMSRLMERYDRIQVTRDEANELLWRVVATGIRRDSKGDDLGDDNPVVPAGSAHQPPNCS